VFSLILIVLLLFKSIEDAFNDIWGVRLGRSLLMRIVFYWTTLTLGAVLFFSILTLLGVSAAVNVFQQPPGGSDLQALLRWMLPAFALPLLVGFLTLVYRVIPNTHVFWRAAFVGAVVVAALLLLNNVVALLYVKRVVLERSLYGSLAIFPVFMLGLYIFWLYVLIGGVISYAVQNVHFRNSQAAWGSLSESMRERLSLVLLARHFGGPTGRYAQGPHPGFKRVPQPPRPDGADYNIAPYSRNAGYRISLSAGPAIKPNQSQRIQKPRRQLWR
jgi:membrane protein